jgi:hypothetical protein
LPCTDTGRVRGGVGVGRSSADISHVWVVIAQVLLQPHGPFTVKICEILVRTQRSPRMRSAPPATQYPTIALILLYYMYINIQIRILPPHICQQDVAWALCVAGVCSASAVESLFYTKYWAVVRPNRDSPFPRPQMSSPTNPWVYDRCPSNVHRKNTIFRVFVPH